MKEQKPVMSKGLPLKNRKITVQGQKKSEEAEEKKELQQVNLLERAFGQALAGGKEEELLVKERYPDVGPPKGKVSGLEPEPKT